MRFNRNEIDIALAQSGIGNYNRLAKRMGCSPQNLSVIMNRGSCNPVTAGKIANALGVPVSKIVSKED